MKRNCKRCGGLVHESYPHCEDEQDWYCWDCSFIEGLLTEKQYVSWLPICLTMHARVTEDKKIEVWFGKNPVPPSERSNKQQRHSPRYAAWRTQVFERDNYICQDCGIRGGRLNAHHLKSWKDYKKLRYKVDNGITLCEKCHRKRHSKREVV